MLDPRSTANKLKLLLADEKQEYVISIENKTKPFKRVELFIPIEP